MFAYQYFAGILIQILCHFLPAFPHFVIDTHLIKLRCSFTPKFVGEHSWWFHDAEGNRSVMVSWWTRDVRAFTLSKGNSVSRPRHFSRTCIRLRSTERNESVFHWVYLQFFPYSFLLNSRTRRVIKNEYYKLHFVFGCYWLHLYRQ